MASPATTAAEPVKPLQTSRRSEWLFAVALLAVTLAAYYPAWFGKPVWDDDAHMTQPQLRSFAGLWRIWAEPGATQQYYPLVHSVFWLEHRLWGDATLGYHLLNILLHVFCALLLLKILRLLEIPGARLAAALFALHPVEVESVAWISELKNTLSGAFYLGASLIYLRFDRSRERRLYISALALFFLGLLCKTVIATLPAALLVVFWWKRGRLSWKRDARPLVPFFVLGGAMGVLTAYVEKKYVIGVEGGELHFTLVERCLIAGRAFWFYIGKLLWPAKLIFTYPRWDVSQRVWWQYIFPAAALALLGALWMLRKRTRAPLAAALFFGGTLAPALGFVNVYPFVYSFVADHFQYLAGIGVITLASAGAALALGRLRGGLKTAAQLFGAAILLLLAALTWRQSGFYTDARTLYTKTIEQNPQCWLAWNNLGNVLLSTGDVNGAISHFQKSLEIKPDYAKAENNLGIAFYDQGKITDAISHFEKALAITPYAPAANNNLANILLDTGHADEAIAHYKKALEIQPDYVAAYNGLGNAWLQKGDLDQALANYEKTIELQPDFAKPYIGIGNIFLRRSLVPAAISWFDKARKYDPNNTEALNNLAWLLSTAGSSVRNGARAVELAEKANRLSGGEDAGILGTLAAAYAEDGRFPEAVTAAEHALRLASSHNDTRMVNLLNMQLRFYRAGTPYHQSP